MMAEQENQMPEISELKSEKISINDRMVRFIGIPFFGLVIPSATGLIKIGEFNIELAMYYLYFILVAWIIWEGNRYLLFRNYPVIFQSHSVIQKYLWISSLNIFYTAPVSFLMLYGWKSITNHQLISNQVLINNVILIVVCVIFVTNAYEKALFSKKNEQEKTKREQLERGKLEAELEALKNQIDPHFIFNTLNSLSYLIDHDVVKAQKFINHLAEVFRYILGIKDKGLVLLQEEISFMEAYKELIALRYGKGFSMQVNFNEVSPSEYLIPPVSMMVAMENAVKHNEVSKKNQLLLHLEMEDHQLCFFNKISPRKAMKISTRTGLDNLNERFFKLTGKEIRIEKNESFFRLYLPLLKLSR
jgi:sensor histidine kinase YesM